MKAPAFHPHFNRSLGKYYHSARDYYGDLKKGGYVPFDANMKQEGERKAYKPSEDAKKIMHTLSSMSKRGEKIRRDSEVGGLMRKLGVKFEVKQSDLDKLPSAYQPKDAQGGIYD